MTSNIRYVTVAIATLAVTACNQQSKDAPASTASSATVVSDDDVPVAEDFITQTTSEVTDQNYAAELDKLEKEINSGN